MHNFYLNIEMPAIELDADFEDKILEIGYMTETTTIKRFEE